MVTLVARSTRPAGLPHDGDRLRGTIDRGGIVEDCLFCKIVAGEIPAEVVHTTERTVAFRDINAQAPTHVLVVPRDHHANAAALAAADPQASAELVTAAAAVAAAEGHDDYRLVYNTGAGVGQTVFHTHLHLLAGRRMTWPPG
jgi:histidine triad (HIT) family protein